jgi:hypothetical protein
MFPIPDWRAVIADEKQDEIRNGQTLKDCWKVWERRWLTQETLRKSSVLDLQGEELDDMSSDGSRGVVLRSVLASVVGLVWLNNGNDTIRVDRDGGSADTVGSMSDKVGLSVRREERLVDVVHPLEARELGVDLDDDVSSAGDDLGGGSDRGSWNDRSVLEDLGGFDDGPVEVLSVSGRLRLVLVVEAVGEVLEREAIKTISLNYW